MIKVNIKTPEDSGNSDNDNFFQNRILYLLHNSRLTVNNFFPAEKTLLRDSEDTDVPELRLDLGRIWLH
jgi:hypothetical protein